MPNGRAGVEAGVAGRGGAEPGRAGAGGLAGPARRDKPPQRILPAIALMCGTVFCFACLDASAKWANRSVDPLVTTWMRYLGNVLVMGLVLNPWTRPRLLHSNRLRLQVVRSLLLFASTVLNFFALLSMPLTQNLSIQFAMPLLVAVLAGPLLGEWIGARRLVVVLVGFAGILVITRPGTNSLPPAAILTVLNTICYALYAIVTRQLAAFDPPATTMTYSALAGAVLLAPAMPFIWTQPPTALTWAVLCGTGVFGAVGHGMLTLAHAWAPASTLSPFIYVQIVWTTLLGYLIFGDVPDRWTLVGTAIVITSGLYLLLVERRPRA